MTRKREKNGINSTKNTENGTKKSGTTKKDNTKEKNLELFVEVGEILDEEPRTSQRKACEIVGLPRQREKNVSSKKNDTKKSATN